jgi:hypothetical protein
VSVNDELPLRIVAIAYNPAIGAAFVVDSDGRVWEPSSAGWRVSQTPTHGDLERWNERKAAQEGMPPPGPGSNIPPGITIPPHQFSGDNELMACLLCGGLLGNGLHVAAAMTSSNPEGE